MGLKCRSAGRLFMIHGDRHVFPSTAIQMKDVLSLCLLITTQY
jgi:hypothetical protein